MGRSYSDAISALNSLQSNYEVVKAIQMSGRGMNKLAIPEMIEWCRRAGYEPRDFNQLNAVHVAGTKGKGSTSAFISSILTQYPELRGTFHKVGLYTSPHLRFVRERIRINNDPLTEEAFAKHFFTIWDRLEEAAKTSPPCPSEPTKPVYFRFLTLIAFHAYLQDGVNSAIIECGIGGEYDSTNILLEPSVTGITSLGIDHTAMLGSTIEEIAWHKAGVMKQGAVCFTVAQPEGAMQVLRSRAQEKGVELRTVDVHPEIADGSAKLGLAADFQKVNASIAVEIAAEHLRRMGFSNLTTNPLPAEFKKALQLTQWGGRCETRREDGLSWHLDGGHTIESIEVAAKWFAECVLESASTNKLATSSSVNGTKQAPDPVRVLIFNQQTRVGKPLLKHLYDILSTALKTSRPLNHAIFCTNTTYKESGFKPDLLSINNDNDAIRDLTVQKELAQTWSDIEAGKQEGQTWHIEATEATVVSTIEEAIAEARKIARVHNASLGTAAGAGRRSSEVEVFVTGSVHLIGGVLEVLETEIDAQSA